MLRCLHASRLLSSACRARVYRHKTNGCARESRPRPAAKQAELNRLRMKKLLALNRSEIAIRIMRAATELGLHTVAIFSKEDRLSLHRFKADEAYEIGEGKGPVEAYLDVDGIVALAKEKGIDAIHPGYGFLAENPALPRACERAGITFVGPDARLLELLGDKRAARKLAQ